MSNEEIAIKIQSGERDLVPELWNQVEKFVRLMANRRLRHLPPSAGIEFDDLYDAGFLAVLDAVERFDPSQDTVFITLLTFTLRTAFAEAGGYRSRRQQRDPIHRAASLDEPVSGTEDLTVGDAVADDGAQAAFEDAEHRIYLEQLHSEMEGALAKLTAQQADILRRRYYNCETLQSIGTERHISPEAVRQEECRGLRYLRRPKIFRRLYRFAYPEAEYRIDQKTNFYRRSGVSRFNSTGSSSVEEMVIMREQWRQEAIDREVQETDELLADIHREIDRILKATPWLREKLEATRNQSEEVN